MFLNLLDKMTDSPMFDKKIGIGEAAIDALLGFIVVFVGIALLVAIVWAVGKIMQSLDCKGGAPKKAASEKAVLSIKSEAKPVAAKSTDEIDDETLAVITAAIAACYAEEKRSCGFVVKRIKRM